jgi:SMODS-associating 2TM, beta-strand rich effector domain
MKSNFLQYYKPEVLIGLIVTLAIGLFLTKEIWQLQFGIIGSITTLLVFINKYLWKYKPFTWMYWIEDFSGRYEGELEYQYRNEKGAFETGRLKYIKIIKQSGSCISVTSFTIDAQNKKSSESKNIGMYVGKEEDEHFRIIFNYRNEGNPMLSFPPHYGTNIIKFIRKENGEKHLSGRYFTERQPFQTKGQFIDLKKVNNNLIHDF